MPVPLSHTLDDPGTIVITAAAPERTSFGCSDDRDLTYFGEAFYRDALPKARSLEEALSLAKAAIAERESSEHITPSEPQAYFGADIDRVMSQHYMDKPACPQNRLLRKSLALSAPGTSERRRVTEGAA